MYSLLLTVHLAVYLPPNCLLTMYSVGNVIDLAPLGLAVHNVEWETEAALAFLRLGALHVKQGRAAAFYLHLCTTLTHSPGPRAGVCSDPRLSAAGLSAAAPAVQPTRASVMARTGADGGGGDRYTAAGADRWRCDALDPNPDPDPDPDPNPEPDSNPDPDPDPNANPNPNPYPNPNPNPNPSPNPNLRPLAVRRLSLQPLAPSLQPHVPSCHAGYHASLATRCGWEEYDASHTLWLDDAVGAVLAELRALGAERDTLFIVLADHQRLGKGTLYQGVRTPQVPHSKYSSHSKHSRARSTKACARRRCRSGTSYSTWLLRLLRLLHLWLLHLFHLLHLLLLHLLHLRLLHLLACCGRRCYSGLRRCAAARCCLPTG